VLIVGAKETLWQKMSAAVVIQRCAKSAGKGLEMPLSGPT